MTIVRAGHIVLFLGKRKSGSNVLRREVGGGGILPHPHSWFIHGSEQLLHEDDELPCGVEDFANAIVEQGSGYLRLRKGEVSKYAKSRQNGNLLQNCTISSLLEDVNIIPFTLVVRNALA